MGGGLMQLVAYGAQDVYISGNPQITFFKVVYRRHTNFSVEAIEHSINNAGFGKRATVTVTRNGDLATKMYLKVTLAATAATGSGCNARKWAYVKKLGHALIKSVEVEIGGSKIDKQYGVWMDIWYELSHEVGQEDGYNRMIGNVAELTDMSSAAREAYTLYIPLQFWFCRNTGLALPLIALQYHEVRVHFEFNNASELIRWEKRAGSTSAPAAAAGISMSDASLLVDYVFLDSEERRRFAQVGHEYLIEQLQHTGDEPASEISSKYKLQFNHPTKELVWAVRQGKFMGSTFLGETVDEAAKLLVKGMYATRAAGTSADEVSEGSWTSTRTTDENHMLVDDDFTVAGVDGVVHRNYGYSFNVTLPGTSTAVDLVPLITYSTAIVNSSGCITVTSVDHTITAAHVTASAASIGTSNDERLAYDADFADGSFYGEGVVVNQFDNYGINIDGSVNPVSTALIQLNGHDRFDTQNGDYFNFVQPWQHHTNTPPTGVNVYSFALSPEQHQPTGTANLSRIDNTQLNITYRSSGATNATNKCYIFGFSYNVLRVMSGMGGLAYSN